MKRAETKAAPQRLGSRRFVAGNLKDPLKSRLPGNTNWTTPQTSGITKRYSLMNGPTINQKMPSPDHADRCQANWRRKMARSNNGSVKDRGTEEAITKLGTSSRKAK